MALYKHQYRIESARLKNWDYRWNAAYFITVCTMNKEHFFGEIVPVEPSHSRAGFASFKRDIANREGFVPHREGDVAEHGGDVAHSGGEVADREGDVAVQRLYVGLYGDSDYDMKLSEIGRIAWDCWMEIPNHFRFVTLDAFTVMPNHIHGILIINNSNQLPVETLHYNVSKTQHNVSDAQHNTSDTHPNDPDSLQNVGLNSDITIPLTGKNNPEEIIRNETMAAISPKKGSVSVIMRSYKSAVTKQAHLINPRFEWQERFHDHIIRTEEEFKKIQNYIITNTQNWKKDKFNAG